MNPIADQLFIRLQSRFPKMNLDVFIGVSLWLLQQKSITEDLDTLTHEGAYLLEDYWHDIDEEAWPHVIEQASGFMPKPAPRRQGKM